MKSLMTLVRNAAVRSQPDVARDAVLSFHRMGQSLRTDVMATLEQPRLSRGVPRRMRIGFKSK